MNKELIKQWSEFKKVKRKCICEPLSKNEGMMVFRVSHDTGCLAYPYVKTDIGIFLDYLSANFIE